MPNDNDMNDEVDKKNEELVTEREEPSEVGESGDNPGADSAAEPAAAPGIDYATILETLSAIQANQAKMNAQIQKISDAQSVMVDAGAVIRENDITSSGDVTDDKSDGFVSIDELDLSI